MPVLDRAREPDSHNFLGEQGRIWEHLAAPLHGARGSATATRFAHRAQLEPREARMSLGTPGTRRRAHHRNARFPNVVERRCILEFHAALSPQALRPWSELFLWLWRVSSSSASPRRIAL